MWPDQTGPTPRGRPTDWTARPLPALCPSDDEIMQMHRAASFYLCQRCAAILIGATLSDSCQKARFTVISCSGKKRGGGRPWIADRLCGGHGPVLPLRLDFLYQPRGDTRKWWTLQFCIRPYTKGDELSGAAADSCRFHDR